MPSLLLPLTPSERAALTLSTLAGASTTLGAAAAVLRRPGPAALAFLLGLAAGVMGLLSLAELWVANALEHGWAGVTAALVAGAAAYAWAAPRLPSLEGEGGPLARLFGVRAVGGGGGDGGGGGGGAAPTGTVAATKTTAATAATASTISRPSSSTSPPPPPPTPAELLRLGLVLAVTMTLHNLPEGIAVGSAALSGAGGHVAAAVAAHNIPEVRGWLCVFVGGGRGVARVGKRKKTSRVRFPSRKKGKKKKNALSRLPFFPSKNQNLQGIVVAAPVYAATGSRGAALAIAAASGLSEPVGAAGALLAARAWDWWAGGDGAVAAGTGTEGGGILPYLLAGAGGVMAAVCVLDLLPEARRCGAPGRLVAGVVVGAGVMAATLAAGV
jgi:zinc transporter, ZIP family